MNSFAPPETGESQPHASRQPSPRAEMIARAVVIVVLYSSIGILCLRTSPGSDPDIWWQMSSARWILQHHAFPHHDPFSRLSPSPYWIAYSWLFEVITYSAYRLFSLVGLMGFVVVMVLAILAAMHRMTERLQGDFLKAMLLTGAGILSFSPSFTPRSWLFSIFFFVLQLDLLHRARSSGRWQKLLWLLPIYAIWANLHIQFIDGLVVLAATACEPLLMRFWPWPETPRFPAGKLFAILGGCLAVTLINPYGWGIYHSAYGLVTEPGVINQIQELLAMPFRNVQNYLVLALAVGAAAALARRKQPDLWRVMLLVMGLVISFRSQRDVWFLVVIAVMVLAEELPASSVVLRPLPKLAWPAIAAAVVAILFAAGAIMHVNDAGLRARMSKKLPVKAANFILEKHYPGPLFNTYGWGGYFIWKLRMPVAIDGRAALYGEKRLDRSLHTWEGAPDWAANPNLKAARLVVGPAKEPLIQLLGLKSDFHQVYKGKVAAVFVRNAPAKVQVRQTPLRH